MQIASAKKSKGGDGRPGEEAKTRGEAGAKERSGCDNTGS